METIGDGAELLRRAEDAAVVSDGEKSDRDTREMNPANLLERSKPWGGMGLVRVGVAALAMRKG